ncbi:anaphase-promoting complex subunit 4-like [Aphis craccivora]|uniref:Anaphase-promoting complex subunit 4-like n=1 Tax=Aphis craccivora TaxID=307492 RepID=A0A6G0ZMY4_APHCR|nr:anaphase-promoting complex subunit 4-like [Aphis craccivora]
MRSLPSARYDARVKLDHPLSPPLTCVVLQPLSSSHDVHDPYFMTKTKKRPLSVTGRTLRSNIKVLDESESANKRSRRSVPATTTTTTTMMAI